MTLKVTLDPTSLAYLQYAMAQLPRRVGIRHLRIALNAWGGVVKKEAVARVRTDTKTLRRSIGVRVIIPDASWNVNHHGKPSRVIVGPRRRSGRMVRQKKSGGLVGYGAAQRLLAAERKRLAKTTGIRPIERERQAVKSALASFANATYRNPTRYAHLVEKGHGGPVPAKAYPFIAPAQQAGNTRGLAKLIQKLRQGIEQEALKLAARQRVRVRP